MEPTSTQDWGEFQAVPTTEDTDDVDVPDSKQLSSSVMNWSGACAYTFKIRLSGIQRRDIGTPAALAQEVTQSLSRFYRETFPNTAESASKQFVQLVPATRKEAVSNVAKRMIEVLKKPDASAVSPPTLSISTGLLEMTSAPTSSDAALKAASMIVSERVPGDVNLPASTSLATPVRAAETPSPPVLSSPQKKAATLTLQTLSDGLIQGLNTQWEKASEYIKKDTPCEKVTFKYICANPFAVTVIRSDEEKEAAERDAVGLPAVQQAVGSVRRKLMRLAICGVATTCAILGTILVLTRSHSE